VSRAAGAADLLAAVPDTVPSLSGTQPALARAAAGGGPFLAEGRRARALGDEAGVALLIDGRELVVAGRSGRASTANTLVAPGLVRRERVGPAGAFIESVLAAPALPLLCVQWEASALPMPELALTDELARTVDARQGPDGTLPDGVIVAALEPGRLAALAVVPSSCRLVARRAGRTVEVEAPADAGAVSLLAVAGTPAEVRAALAAAAHLRGHAVQAGAAPPDGLELRTGVPELDDGLAWARARTAARAHSIARALELDPRPDATLRRAALLHGLSTLVAGDVDGAYALHRALPPSAVERALLAARIAAITGDQSPALAAASALEAGVPDDDPMWRTALPMLGDALRYAASEEAIASLRRMRRAGPAGATPAPGGTGRRLPMAGGGTAPDPPRSDAGFRPRALLAGDAPPFPDDPDGAWATWRAHLAAGLDAGPGGPATWDVPFGRPAGRTTHAAQIVLDLAHGLLGLAPDAPVGRIRMAPRFPEHVRSFELRGIAIGDGRLALTYERLDEVVRFTVEPEAGPVPPLLVLEPLVAGGVARVRVDGAEAQLETRAANGRVVVPVQLAVDRIRTLEIERDPTA
jgi:hypothetical protein